MCCGEWWNEGECLRATSAATCMYEPLLVSGEETRTGEVLNVVGWEFAERSSFCDFTRNAALCSSGLVVGDRSGWRISNGWGRCRATGESAASRSPRKLCLSSTFSRLGDGVRWSVVVSFTVKESLRKLSGLLLARCDRSLLLDVWLFADVSLDFLDAVPADAWWAIGSRGASLPFCPNTSSSSWKSSEDALEGLPVDVFLIISEVSWALQLLAVTFWCVFGSRAGVVSSIEIKGGGSTASGVWLADIDRFLCLARRFWNQTCRWKEVQRKKLRNYSCRGVPCLWRCVCWWWERNVGMVGAQKHNTNVIRNDQLRNTHLVVTTRDWWASLLKTKC